MSKSHNSTREYNNYKSIKGKDFEIIKSNYYAEYYNNFNDVYITDYNDEDGNLLYMEINVVPRESKLATRKYLGSKIKKS